MRANLAPFQSLFPESMFLHSIPVCRNRRGNGKKDATRRFVKLAGHTLICLSLGACTLSKTMSFNDEPDIFTASIAAPAKAEGIDTTDTDIIKTVVVGAEEAKPPSNLLAWSNPDTGNHGTIMAIDKFVGNKGQNCKKFQTTVDSFMGISIYNGETCELRKGMWVLSQFIRD
jgi:surface antigen